MNASSHRRELRRAVARRNAIANEIAGRAVALLPPDQKLLAMWQSATDRCAKLAPVQFQDAARAAT